MNEIVLTMLAGIFLAAICYLMYKNMPWSDIYNRMKNFVNDIIGKIKGIVGK